MVRTDMPFVSGTPTAARWHARLPCVVTGLCVYLVLICAGSRLLNDPDSQWHVAVGRWIWANGRVPTTDVFSHTFQGAPWIAKEWGAQVLLFAAYLAAGWSGVVALAAAPIALTFAVLHDWLRRRLRPTVALALTLVAGLACAPHLLARPHALVLPVMVIWVMRLIAAREREAAPPLWLALLMALWANLHGSFPLGLALAGLLACEAVVLGTSGDRLTRVRDWGLFLAAASAATLLTPYGWRALLVPLRMTGSNEALPFIAEWQPLGFDLAGLLSLVLLGVVVWALLARPGRNLFRLVAVALLAFMMVRHGRFIDQFVLLGPVLAASALGLRRGLEPATADAPPRALASLMGPLAGVLALVAAIATLRAAPAPDPAMTPEAALGAAQARNLKGPIYNDYDFGGFLIARAVPTFIDGRTDQLFLGGFLTGLDKVRRAPADAAFADLLARHKVTWALVRPSSLEARHLARMQGWSEIYRDDVAAVFAIAR